AAHTARLHWLGGAFPFTAPADGVLELLTPAGPYRVSVHDGEGRPLTGSVVAGAEDPPRGWQSRYYSTKEPVPSLAVERAGDLPLTFVTLLAPAGVTLARLGTTLVVRTPGAEPVGLDTAGGILRTAEAR
ncbi:MAG TPA: hypothetical protein VFH51_11125, partial [Myxococcota bacterium]|nr:hypothetical protein [Myxococcota bacterium]